MFCRLRQCRQILPKLNLSAILLLFLIKRAALGNLKVNFHCTHLHRFFPLKKGLSKTHQSSLTLKGGSTSHLGLLPSGKKRKPPYSVLKPLRYMVGGPSEVYASSGAAVFVRGWTRLAEEHELKMIQIAGIGGDKREFYRPVWLELRSTPWRVGCSKSINFPTRFLHQNTS